MSNQKGYYSLVQYCPDASRLEAVNVGVVLFCPDSGFIAARMSKGINRASKLVGRANLNKEALAAARRALQRRFEVDHASFRTVEDLSQFAASRANMLRMSPPRPLLVSGNASEFLITLFKDLVGGPPTRVELQLLDTQCILPELRSALEPFQSTGRARFDLKVNIPIVNRQIDIPYASRNGLWKLVKPQRFSAKETQALNVAMQLAIEGDLLHKHGFENDQAKLFVVASYDQVDDETNLSNRVEKLLQEYQVTTILRAEVKSRIQEFVPAA